INDLTKHFDLRPFRSLGHRLCPERVEVEKLTHNATSTQRKGGARSPALCLRCRRNRRDVAGHRQRHAEGRRLVPTAGRLPDVGRSVEFDPAAGAGDAEPANGLIADLRGKLAQCLMSRWNFSRVGIDEIDALERELITALCHDVTSAPRRTEVTG